MPDTIAINKPILALAGLFGAAGVALAALASHSGDTTLGIAASFLQLHAPALIGLSFLAVRRLAAVAAWVLVAGLVLFCGEIVLHVLVGIAFLGAAAPIGGTLLILGWLLVAASAFRGGGVRAR